jgi:hypothetical protein
MSLLTIVQQAALRIGVTSPNAVVSSTDANVTRLLALANEEGQELSARYEWQALRNEATFTTVATASQGALTTLAGADFRYMINETFWNRTQRRPIFGPLTDQQWQQIQAQQILGPWYQYIIRGGNILFTPTPAAGQTCAFEWVSKNWCSDSTGATTRALWAADTDIGRISEELMTFGLVWRWKQSLGLDYTEDYNKYEKRVADAMAQDGTKPRINMGQNGMDVYPGVIVPSGNWVV